MWKIKHQILRIQKQSIKKIYLENLENKVKYQKEDIRQIQKNKGNIRRRYQENPALRLEHKKVDTKKILKYKENIDKGDTKKIQKFISNIKKRDTKKKKMWKGWEFPSTSRTGTLLH